MREICKARYQSFGTAGQADKITRVYSFEEMSKRYQQGEWR